MRRALIFTLLLVALAGARAGQSQSQTPSEQAQSRAGSVEADREYQSALALFKQEKFDEASAAAKRAVELREQNDGRDSPLTAQALLLLASVNRLTGRVDQAEPLYRRAVAIWEQKPDDARSDYVSALEGYSCLLRKAGREEDAEKYGRRASQLIRLAASPPPPPSKLTLGMSPVVIDKAATEKPQPEAAPGEAGAGGSVAVEVLVDESGNVILACAQSGPVRLREASERTAYRWRFRPTQLRGEPVKVSGTITFTFKPQ